MVADNRYSRFVGTAKIVFPLLALGFLSTIFLFSRTLDPSAAIPFSDIDIEKIAKEQRLASPKFSGVTSDGSAISVQAESARPDLLNPRRLSATKVTASIKTLGKDVYDIRADSARFDGTNDDLSLMGNVVITSSSGYALRTESLVANLETTGFVAESDIEGTAPTGTITAGRMELVVKDGSQVLLFTNGVKLIYEP
jgi:lipopolysaccharide export system protein LptC